MAINASIPLGVQPMQIQSPVNQLARVLQIKEMQQTGQLNAMKMDEYKRGIEETNALRSDLSAPDADPYKVLLRRGKVKEATDFLKGKADVEKTGAETEYKKIEAAHKRVDLMGQSLGWLRQNPSIENAQMLAEYWQANGVADPQKVQGMLAQVQANPTPQAIAQFAEMGFRAALSTKEQLPKLQTNNIGGATVTQQFDPVTGRQLGQSAIQNTQSPDAQLQAQTSEANNRRSVGAQYDLNRATREAAATQAAATREAAQIRRDQDTEMKLADDYRAQSKTFKEVSDAHKTIKTSLKSATTSPAATLAGATKFMKLLDPGSVVRESELGMALAATGALDRAAWYFNTLKNGKTLNPKQAKDFEDIADQIYQGAQQQQQMIDKDYRAKADAYKLRGDMIVQDLGQNKQQPVNLNQLPKGGAGKVINFGDLK